MPIGTGDAYRIHRNRYEHIIHPAVEAFRHQGEQIFKCVRADFVAKSGSITRDLIGRLYRSRVVIADLTELNPNVFYELGVRHALRSGTILVALQGTKPPFDVGDLRIISYEDRVGGEKDAIPQIQAALEAIYGDARTQDSPVLQAVPELAELCPQKEQEARYAALVKERDLLRAQLDVLERSTLSNQAALLEMSKALFQLQSQLSGKEAKDAQAAVTSIIQARTHESVVSRPLNKTGVTTNQRSIFILMPFDQKLEPIFEAITAIASRHNLHAYRADSIVMSGPIIDQIYEAIAGAGLVIADLTETNANVFYELGIAKALSKEILLLSQAPEMLPFDVAHQRAIKYEPTKKGIEALRSRLSAYFKLYVERI